MKKKVDFHFENLRGMKKLRGRKSGVRDSINFKDLDEGSAILRVCGGQNSYGKDNIRRYFIPWYAYRVVSTPSPPQRYR